MATDPREWMLWRRSSTEVGADGPIVAAGEKSFAVVPKARAEAAEQLLDVVRNERNIYEEKAQAHQQRVRELERLVRTGLDALDAEKTPNYEEGHDRAVAALIEGLTGKPPVDRYRGPMVTLSEIEGGEGS